jgi:HSP90 family molecular chaperone
VPVRVGINAHGFRTAVRDYTPPTVVEEISANSYDADAQTVIVLLDSTRDELHVVDDGIGFTKAAIELAATLGGGGKTVPYSKGKRHYLGSYGYGLKSSLNIADSLLIESVSSEGRFRVVLDWTKLDEALNANFEGFPLESRTKKRDEATGTRITLKLRHPTTKSDLDDFGEKLANLPSDDGRFRCYFGEQLT